MKVEKGLDKDQIEDFDLTVENIRKSLFETIDRIDINTGNL